MKRSPRRKGAGPSLAGRAPRPPQLPGLPFPCLCAALRWASRAVTRAYDAELARSGIHPQQHVLLRVLEALGPLSQMELAERALIEKTALSRALRPMLGAGWIEAAPGDDRRQKRITLTPSGRRLLDRALPSWDRAQRRIRGELGEAGWVNALRAIRDLERAGRAMTTTD